MIEQREYEYLQQTLHSLQQTRKQLSATIEHKNASFNDLQKYVVDFHAELDKFEIYDYQQSLRMIDKQAVANVLAKQQIDRLLESPYFGGFDFIYEDDEEIERFYIGRFGHEDEHGQTLIYDWRAPICHMYYEFEIGAAYYEAMQQRFDGELVGKRQIKIEHGELQYVLNSSLTIQDEALQQVLHANGSDKMKTIVTSIQKEQNQIVRDDTAHTLIIQGVAGSGKTAVALHRIAYYLYKYRDTLRAERIFILSPNKVFGHYISSVLPELGEEPIRSFTLDELTERLLPSAVTCTSFEEETAFILANPTSSLAKRAAQKANMAFVEQLQCFLANVDTTILRFEDVKIADIVIEGTYIAQRFDAYRKEPVTVRLAHVADDMMHALKQKRNGELKLPSKNEIVKRLKKRLTYPSAFAIYRAFIETLPKGSFSFKNKHFEFNDVYPYLYVQMYFSGITTFELVQHFVLDEMQDYTPIQYAVLAQLFTCKRTIIGDVGQALFPYETMSLQTLSTIFPRAAIHRLTTTYRSSYEIATYAQQFLEDGMLQPIARYSKEVDERFYATHDDMLQQLHNALSSTAKTTAIICKTLEDAMYISEHLQKPHHVMDGDTTIFETGIIVTTIQYAKGLEFDAVIVPFVDNIRYTTQFERGLLYIAVTRAMHELTVIIDANAPTPLVATV